MENFILGGGITGLTAALYYKKYFVLTKDFGQKEIGPRILRKTEHVDSFLEKFGIDLESKTYKCGYIVDKKIDLSTKIYNKIDFIQKNNYLEKTSRQELKNIMNDGIVEMEGYDMTKLYVKLFRMITARIIPVELLRIDIEKKIIMGKRENYSYNKIVNTLPVSIFNSLLGYSNTTRGTIYAYVFKSEFFDKFLSDFDFLYFTHPGIPFYRITKHEENIFSAESMQHLYFAKGLGYIEILEYVEIPLGKVTENIKCIMVENVFHLGRYATNTQGVRLDEVIKTLEEQ